jgi:hypothetical protein
MLAKLDWQDLNEVINQCFSDKTGNFSLSYVNIFFYEKAVGLAVLSGIIEFCSLRLTIKIQAS